MEMGQLEIDAGCSALGAILGHLTAGGPRTLQAISVNLLAGGSTGFFFGPTLVDYWTLAPGRPSGGMCLLTATLGALVIPTLLRAIRPWTERNADNVIGRVAGKVVGAFAPTTTTTTTTQTSSATETAPPKPPSSVTSPATPRPPKEKT